MTRRGCLWLLGILGGLGLLFSACAGGVLLGSALGSGGAGGLGDAVAVIYVSGTIQGGDSEGLFDSSNTFSDQIISQLKRVQKDRAIKAIVLRVDSPGGGAAASDEIYSKLLEIRQEGKPIVASMGSLAASGGYYVSAAANKILANRNTLTGSIGVISIVPNLQELLDKLGVRTYVFKSGQHKDTGTGLRALSDEEQQIWQSLIADTYERFVQVVAEGRNLDPARVRQLADGRLYSAQQAKDAGLIDDFGDLDDAIELAANLGGIQGKPRVVEFRRRGVLSGLLSRFAASPTVSLERLTGLPRHRTLQYLYVEP